MKHHEPTGWPPILKIATGVALLLLCCFRKQFIPQDNATLTTIGTVVAMGCIVLSLYLIFNGITQLMVASENKKEVPSHLPSEPIKCMTPQELFDFLEKENIIDVVIDNEGEWRVGTSSDSRSGRYKQTTYFDKHYYINEKEYVNFSEFQTRFLDELKGDVVKILYAGIEDMPVKI